MIDEPRIYMRHARAGNLCGPGVERMAERLGYSLEKFLKEGYPCDLADKSSNPMLLKASRLARQEWETEHGKG